jgi:hypothetical protein
MKLKNIKYQVLYCLQKYPEIAKALGVGWEDLMK